jgi:large repetitive protein
MIKIKRVFTLLALLLVFATTQGQHSLEMYPGSPNPTGSGIGTANQVITFKSNVNNPLDNTPSAYTAGSPSGLKVTLSLDNQQFTSMLNNPTIPGAVFGADISSSSTTYASGPFFGTLSSVGGSNDTNYTSCGACTPKTGIAVASNGGVFMQLNTRALINSSGANLYALNARVQYADLTFTFSRPVTNPVLHFSGLGGQTTSGTTATGFAQGFATEFDLLTSGVTISAVSGSQYFQVAGSTIKNSRTTLLGSATGGVASVGGTRYAASGSVLVTGTNITTVKFRMYLKGDGGYDTDPVNNPVWSSLAASGGDGIVVSASLLPCDAFNATATNACNGGTGSISVSPALGLGYTYSIDGTTYTNTSGTFTGVAAGTYTVTAKNADGCISTGSTVTIVNQTCPVGPCLPTSYEMAAGATNTTNTGPTTSNQNIFLQNNTDNPSANTFAAIPPTVPSVQYSIASQTYASPNNGLWFGASGSSTATPGSFALFPLMNGLGGSTSSNYTSGLNSVIGGIDIATNRSLQIYTSTRPLYNASLSTSGRYLMGTITLTFPVAANNPLLHITGLGGTLNNTTTGASLGFTSELELTTAGVTLTKLTGSTELNVTSSVNILNSATTPGATTGSGAASGTIQVNGNYISSLTFKVYLRGNGGLSYWSDAGGVTGDGWLLGVSFPKTIPAAPIPTNNSITGACPVGTPVNLNTLLPATVSGITYEWHTVATNPTSATKISNPTSYPVGSSPVYLYSLNTASNCYSVASVPVNLVAPDCSDCDNDGIINSIDIDDDNDGILDVIESFGCKQIAEVTSVTGGSFTVGAPGANNTATSSVSGLLPNGVGFTLTEATGIAFAATSVTNNTSCFFNYAPNFNPAQTANDHITLTVPWQNTNGAYTNTLTQPVKQLYQYINGLDYSKLVFPAGFKITKISGNANLVVSGTTVSDANPDDVNAAACSVNNTSAAAGIISIEKADGSSFLSYTVQNIGNSAVTNSDGYQFNFALPYCHLDTDGDGIPNSCDLDSDGDGCPDAYEAGIVNTLGVQTVAAPYGANGFANSLETALDNGIPTYNTTTVSADYNFYADSAGLSRCCTGLTAGPDVSVCKSKSVTLAGTAGPAGSTYTWTALSGNPGTATIVSPSALSTVVNNFSTTGVFKFSITNTYCTDTVSVTVNADPIIALIAGPDKVCLGNVINLTNATAGGTWISKYPAIATVNASGGVTGVTAGVDTIYYKFTNASGCSDSVLYKVTVNPLPVATVTAGGPTTFCSGGSVLFSALSAPVGESYTYQWNLNGSPIAGATSSTYNATGTGNYTVTITSGNGCVATSSTQTVTVNAPPPATITSGALLGISCGGSTTLTANAGAGFTYQWYKDGALISGANSQTYSASAAGDYTVVVTNASGCSTTSNVTKVVAVPSISSNGTLAACQGSSVQLTADGSAAASPIYLWYKDGVSTGVTTAVYNATASGSYYFSLSDGATFLGNSCPISVTINANPAPVAAPVAGNSVCAGGSVALSTGTFASYQWLLNGNPISGATSQTYNATQTGNYSVRVTNAGGCIGTSATTPVTIIPQPAVPTPTVLSKSNVCPLTTVDLSSLQPTAIAGTTLEWHTASSNPTAGTLVAMPTSVTAGTYYLYAKSAAPNNCYSVASAPVVITITTCTKPDPDVNITSVNKPVTGSVATNDKVVPGSTYGTPVPNSGNPPGATITMNPNGTYTFSSPNPGVYTFMVPVCAPAQAPPCPLSELKITVLPENSPTAPPVANTDIASTPAGSPVTLNTLANDKCSTPNCSLNPASVTVTNPPLNGTTSVDPLTGNITYTPNPGFVGTDTLTYEVCDNNSPATCTLAKQVITVNPPGAPNTTVGADDYNSTTSDKPATGNVKTNDSDPEGNTQTITAQTTTIPGKGTLVLNTDGTYTFTPVPGYEGPVSFPYQVCDNGTPAVCDSATLYILVKSATEPKPDVNATYTNTPVTGNVSTNDDVPAGSTYGTPVPQPGNPSGGTITMNPDGTYTFSSPNPGVYTYLVPVCEPGQVPPCKMAELRITVLDKNATNNPPVANTDITSTLQNTPVVLPTLANDKSGNASTTLNPASVAITGPPANGTATVNPATGNITYTPNPGFVGTDTLTYLVCDNGSPAQCTQAKQIITVLPNTVNTTAAADDYNSVPNNGTATGNVLLNDKDPQGNTQTVTPQTTTIPGKGTLVLNADGTYTFTPVAGFEGPVEFPYTVCDNGTPQACTKATLHILVGPSPTPRPDINVTYTNQPVAGNVSTNDAVPAGTTYGTPVPDSGNPPGAVLTMNSNGTYSFVSPNPGTYYYNVPVCGVGQVPPSCPLVELKIVVLDKEVNNNPPVAAVDLATTPINTPVTLSTLANDKCSNAGCSLDPASVAVIDPPSNGTFTINPASGNITYTPNTGFVGTDTLYYKVCDNGSPSKCDTAMQIITVLPTSAANNTAASDDYNTVPSGGTATGNVLSNDNDPQGNTQTVTPQTTTLPGKGTLTLNANGTYTFVAVPGYEGPVEFPYTVCDNGTPQACTKATLHILVTPAPEPEPDVNATYVNVPVTGDVATNDDVAPGSTYGTPDLTGSPSGSNPSITMNPDGTYTFTSDKPGVYTYNVPICAPGQLAPCPVTELKITVLDPTITTNVPVANTDVTTTRVNQPVTLPTLANDRPGNAGSALVPSTVAVTVSPSNGTATVNATTGDITYTPNPGFVGVDTLTYTVCDNLMPANCTTAQQIVTVLPTTAPNNTEASDDYNTTPSGTAVSGSVLTNDKDPQNNTQTVAAQTTTIPGKGTLVLNANGTYTFTPVPGFVGPVHFPYAVCDNGLPQACDSATLYIIVTAAPDPDPDVNVTFVNVPVTGNLNTNDEVPAGTTYGNPVPLPGYTNPSASIPTINPDGTYTFTSPVPGVYNFLVDVCPPGVTMNCPKELLTITVFDPTITTNPPVANTDITTTPLNTPVVLNTLANDLAGNTGGVLVPSSVSVVDPPNNGTFTIDPATGNITYTPNTGFVGTDTLRYKVCDNTSPAPLCAEAYQIVTVTPPSTGNTTVAADDYNKTTVGTPVSGNVLTNDKDPEGHARTVTPQTTSIPGVGTLVLAADGSYTFTPDPTYTGPVEFPYTVCDNGTPQACTKATIYFTVVDPMALSIDELRFAGTISGNNNLLQWQMINQDGKKGYELQKRNANNNFVPIYYIDAAAGSGSNRFQYADASFNSLEFYKLKVVRTSGSWYYSQVVRLSRETNALIVTYPNPTSSFVTVSGLLGTGRVKLLSVNGSILSTVSVNANTVTIPMQHLAAGVYILQYENNNKITSIRVIKTD